MNQQIVPRRPKQPGGSGLRSGAGAPWRAGVWACAILQLVTLARGAVVIDFEDLNAPPNGTSGLQVANQYAAQGITFNRPAALDYSQGVPVLSGFAHSGTKAIELCHGSEFCTDPLEMKFTAAQSRVKVWLGYSFSLSSAQGVVLRAYDSAGHSVAQTTVNLGPSTGVIPISTPLEVSTSTAVISRATVGFLGAEAQPAQIFNNSLAVDDVEFDTQGPPPVCPAVHPPALTVTSPADGTLLVLNTFNLDATVTTPDPFGTFQVDVTAAGNHRTLGPLFLPPGGQVHLTGLTDFLFPGQNTLTITAHDCAGNTQVNRTVYYRSDVTSTTVRVIDESNLGVPSAEVYVDGSYRGLTDSAGNLVVKPALPDGTQLVARKFITESSTYRDNHGAGSYQNWKYRVYITNLSVHDDGTTPAQPVVLEPDPTAPQVLRVLRQNTLLGLHVVASLEWDASDAELADVKDHFIKAAPFLYNATDGQMVFEQIEIVDDATDWEDADYRIYANLSLRSYVDSPLGGFFDDSFWTDGSWIHIPRSPCVGCSSWFSKFQTYIHEFGHYGFALGDEYSDDDPNTQCTGALSVKTAPSAFQGGGPSASCIMFLETSASKYCSTRPENPHVHGTDQGDSSCWHDIVNRFKDGQNPQRWIMQSPETRGAIPGQINGGHIPVKDWAPRITLNNHARPNQLCSPLTFVAVKDDGSPMADQEIWLLTTYGAQIYEGQTDKNGQIQATGLHVGDRVGFAGWAGAIAGLDYYTIQSGDCAAVTAAAAHAMPLAHGPIVHPLAFTPAAFNLFATLEPTDALGQVLVRVSVEPLEKGGPVKLTEPPTVFFALSGQDSAQPLALQFDPKTKTYVGLIGGMKVDAEVSVEVTATDVANHTVTRVERLGLTGIDPERKTTIVSADGALSLQIPPGAAAAGASAGIGPSPVAPPPLQAGFGLVVGPYSVKVSSGDALQFPGTLRFHLPRLTELSGASGFDPDTFHVLRYDAATGQWADLGPGLFLPAPTEKVILHTQQLGVFALVGRPMPTEVAGPDVSKAVPTVAQLWPPDHRLVRVGIQGVTSKAGAVSIVINKITSDEPTQSTEAGDQCPDGINDGATARLRAERLGQGSGRVYTIEFTASDASGQASTGRVKVQVPHDKKGAVVPEHSPSYDATQCLRVKPSPPVGAAHPGAFAVP